MRSHLAHRARRRAFTLIELLTVIAIVALLAAILIPTLNSARQTAKSSRVLSNLRQIANTVFFYAADNNDTLPGRLNEGQTGYYKTGNGNLVTYLAPYLGCPEYIAGPALPCAIFLDQFAEPDSDESTRRFFVMNMRVSLDEGKTFVEPFGRAANPSKMPLRTPDLAYVNLPRTRMMFALDKLNASQTGQGSIDWDPPLGDVRPIVYFDAHVEMEDVNAPAPSP